jgi:hypothetical protein
MSLAGVFDRGGSMITYAGALCLRCLLVVLGWCWLVMACLCLSLLFWEGVKG